MCLLMYIYIPHFFFTSQTLEFCKTVAVSKLIPGFESPLHCSIVNPTETQLKFDKDDAGQSQISFMICCIQI